MLLKIEEKLFISRGIYNLYYHTTKSLIAKKT